MRIVALTPDPSLGAALNMIDDWEITSVRDVDGVIEVARGAAIVLIGVGGMEEGLDVAQQIHSRGVTIPVLVVGEGPVPASTIVPTLPRPFSLDDLRNAVVSAIEGAPVVAAASDPPEEPGAVVVELRPKESPSVREIGAEQAVVTVSPVRPAREMPPAPPKPAPQEADRKELRRRLTAQRHHIPAPPAAVQDGSRRPEPAGRRLGFGRRGSGAQEVEATESSFIQRLRASAIAARDIEELIEEIPVVADMLAMTEAFLKEAVSAFAPQIASVYWHEPGSFRIVASHGLSRVEQGLIVQDTHPLFTQVLLSSDPVLIAPVDLARGLVSGVAGARTEALMVGPVHIDGECIAALVVGRDDFSDEDLDRMDVLSREAGPGLALARALQSLRAKY